MIMNFDFLFRHTLWQIVFPNASGETLGIVTVVAIMVFIGSIFGLGICAGCDGEQESIIALVGIFLLSVSVLLLCHFNIWVSGSVVGSVIALIVGAILREFVDFKSILHKKNRAQLSVN